MPLQSVSNLRLGLAPQNPPMAIQDPPESSSPDRATDYPVPVRSEAKPDLRLTATTGDAPAAYDCKSNHSQSSAYGAITSPVTPSLPSGQSQHAGHRQPEQSGNSQNDQPASTTDGPTRGLDQLSKQDGPCNAYTPPMNPTTVGSAVQAVNRGQKRTASGASKPSSSSVPGSPVDASMASHSRNTSVTSNATQITEVRPHRSSSLCANRLHLCF